jgi:hypothetical protein
MITAVRKLNREPSIHVDAFYQVSVHMAVSKIQRYTTNKTIDADTTCFY